MNKQELKQIRENAGLTQKQMAKKLGYSEAYVQNMELGHCGISDNVKAKLVFITGKAAQEDEGYESVKQVIKGYQALSTTQKDFFNFLVTGA